MSEMTGLPAGCMQRLVMVTINVTVIHLFINNKYIFNMS